MNHLKYRSLVCRLNLMCRGPCISAAAAATIDLELAEAHRISQAHGMRRHKALLPVVQCAGPLEPILIEPGTESSHHPLGIGHNYHR